jgi:hypothetical protein
MVGRIELVTPEQRDILRQIGRLSAKDIAAEVSLLWTNFYGQIKSRMNELEEVNTGRESLSAFGVAVPRSYQLYLRLGRFRNALILEESRRRPAAGLDSFISMYRLKGYAPVEISAASPAR